MPVKSRRRYQLDVSTLSRVPAKVRCRMCSGQVNVDAILRNQHTRRLAVGMCPEFTVEHFIPCVEGRRRVGTIHSGGRSMANPLENRILRPSFTLSFRVLSRYNFGSCEPNKYAFNAFYF
ncbi:hypothetical protein AVEN_36666-1 [Araneus ventricosus]|uniref:Uncharacterized protein n=1 Tax=Araneus ventricosus TaxID=182803 RepID=A0A4Y2PWV8_ARAVE|nr:hypothetical protein AVEN_221125-1 [Araneus ventricosus]GBN56388.1 hypothetical protein AVEN_36666-1 [Araneus ventricosus]